MTRPDPISALLWLALILVMLFTPGCATHNETITCYAGDGKVIYKAENVWTVRSTEGTGWTIQYKDGRQEWVTGSCVVTVPSQQPQPEAPAK